MSAPIPAREEAFEAWLRSVHAQDAVLGEEVRAFAAGWSACAAKLEERMPAEPSWPADAGFESEYTIGRRRAQSEYRAAVLAILEELNR